MKMESDDLRTELTKDILVQFFESLKSEPYCDYTIDYCNDSNHIPPTKAMEKPTMAQFFVALLKESICNLKPDDSLRHKLKTAAFLISLCSSENKFSVLYDIYHQIEIEVFKKSLNWDQQLIEEMLIEKVTRNVNMMATASPAFNDFEISEAEDNEDDQLMDFSDDELDLDFEGPTVKIQPKREPSDSFAGDLNDDEYSARVGIHFEHPKRKRIKLSDESKSAKIYFTCNICDKRIPELAAFKDHLKEHGIDPATGSNGNTSVLVYTCNICNETVANKSAFRLHLDSHGIESTEEDTFQLSLSLPLNSKELKSSKSKKTLFNRSNLISITQVKKQGDFVNNTQLRTGKIKKPNKTFYTCNLCDKTIQGLSRVKQHMHSHDIDVSNSDVSQYAKIGLDQTGKTASYYTCNICEKTAQGLSRFKQHMKSHDIDVTTNDVAQYAQLGYERTIEKPKTAAFYTCNLCEKTAQGFSRFKQHMQSHNIVVSKTDVSQYAQIDYDLSLKNMPFYTCDICEKSIHGLSRFKQHFATHEKERESEDIDKYVQGHILTDNLPDADPLEDVNVVDDFDIADLKEEVEDSEVNNQPNGDNASVNPKSEIVLEDGDNGTLLESQDENIPVLEDGIDHEEILNNEDILSIEKKEDSFKCEVCNKSFVSRQGIWKHNKAYHESEVPTETKPKSKSKASQPLKWSCSVCAEAFTSRVRLVAHRKASHPKAKADEFGNKCPEPGCVMIGTSRKELNRHWFEVHNSNKLCTKCGYMCTSYEDFISHKKSHKKEETLDETHYMCKICHCTYLGKGGLKRHMRLSHKEDSTGEKIPCNICGKMIAKNGMNTHLQHIHTNVEIQCDLCDYVTNHKYKLATHRKRHFMESKQCTACGVYTKDLGRHVRKCKKLQPEGYIEGCLRCIQCNMTFFKQTTLNKHNEVYHATFKKHSCDLCSYKSEKRTNVRKHYRIMHAKSTTKVRCKFCNKNCVELDKHIRDIHPDEINKSELEV